MPEARETPTGQPIRRILSIDGGGIRGVYPAAFLADLEEDAGEPIGRYFDLIAGTSTGGILAIGIAMGLPVRAILKLYVERGPRIFGDCGASVQSTFGKFGRSVKHYFSPKHDADVLRAELKRVLGDLRIGDAKQRLLVPAWDPDLRSVYIYKTAHHSRLKTDYKKSAVDAAMATAAAPSYYPRHRTADCVGLLDGGVWANNPIALAVVEAITLLGWPADHLRVLSFGCIDEVYMLHEAPGLLGLKDDVIGLFMDGQSRSAQGMAKLLTGHKYERKAIFRYCPEVPKGSMKLDDPKNIERMTGMGRSSARKHRVEIEPVFFGQPAEAFHPLYGQ